MYALRGDFLLRPLVIAVVLVDRLIDRVCDSPNGAHACIYAILTAQPDRFPQRPHDPVDARCFLGTRRAESFYCLRTVAALEANSGVRDRLVT
jgi:hypothetical protein